MPDRTETTKPAVPESCPHCGKPLRPWEQVLLSVDRALMCRNCWYRIYLEAIESDSDNANQESQ